MNLFQVASWGPDGGHDVNYLVAADDPIDAMALAEPGFRSREDCSGRANVCILILRSDDLKTRQVLAGPFLGLSGNAQCMRCWTRETGDSQWTEQTEK